MTTKERTGPRPATDAPVDPGIARQVEALLRRPYRMIIRGEPEEGYLAEVPELPGCVTAGATPEEAIAMLRDAMAGWLMVALEHGDAIPAPRGDPNEPYSGKFVLRVPKSLHRELAERAQQEGVSLNQFTVMALTRGLGLPHYR